MNAANGAPGTNATSVSMNLLQMAAGSFVGKPSRLRPNSGLPIS